MDELLEGAELLQVLREPIEWALTLAHQLADADPVDIAAVARLRAASHARLAGQPIRIRKTDLLIVLGLLIGALDPSIVVRTVSNAVGDGLATVLGSEPPLEIHVTGTVNPFAVLMELVAALRPQRAARSRRVCPMRAQFR